jgi:DNA-binding transcriptional LysR family regulator
MIKRSHIRQFLAVVAAGSFTQAAARLRVTQPTLSLGIAELEKIVGTRLIIRDRRQIRLTEDGGRFLPLARDLEQGFRAADAFGQGPARDWPEIRMGVIRTLPGAALEALIGALSAHVALELLEGTDSELRAAMADGRLDLILGLLRPGESDALELADEPYVMLVPEGHRLHGMVSPEDLASEIMIARRSCEVLDETSRFFTSHQVRPRFAFKSESDERCLHMVVAGLGMTHAPLSLACPGTRRLEVAGYDLRRRLGLRWGPGWNDRNALEQAAQAYRAAISHSATR